MQILNSLGAGSGVDTRSLVEGLVSAERSRLERSLTTRRERVEARMTSLSQISSALNAFDSAFATIGRSGVLERQVQSSESALVSASRLPGTQPPVAATSIEVQALATRQTVTGPAFSNAQDSIGEGVVTLTFGRTGFSGNSVSSFAPDASRQPVTVTISSSNNSLQGLAQAINAASAGVSASIVNDGTGARLVLKGQNGAQSGFSIDVAENGPPGLARFALTSTPSGMSVASSASNSRFSVDGVAMERPDNSISDAVAGLKIDLKRISSGTAVTLSSAYDAASLQGTISNFVDAYNELHGLLRDYTKAATNAADAGPLSTDSSMRELKRQMGALTSQRHLVNGVSLSLADIGVRTGRDGNLSLDSALLSRVVAASPERISGLLTSAQTSSTPSVRVVSNISSVVPGRYVLTDLVPGTQTTPPSGKIDGKEMIVRGNRLAAPPGSSASGLLIDVTAAAPSATLDIRQGLAESLAQLRQRITGNTGVVAATTARMTVEKNALSRETRLLETRMSTFEQRLTRQFGGMDSRVGALKATQAYLQQQIDLWTNKNN
jgi:flagellar hook-associated protein 2